MQCSEELSRLVGLEMQSCWGLLTDLLNMQRQHPKEVVQQARAVEVSSVELKAIPQSLYPRLSHGCEREDCGPRSWHDRRVQLSPVVALYPVTPENSLQGFLSGFKRLLANCSSSIPDAGDCKSGAEGVHNVWPPPQPAESKLGEHTSITSEPNESDEPSRVEDVVNQDGEDSQSTGGQSAYVQGTRSGERVL